jgi:single-stranded-DNA-specific exonuclease
MAAGITVERERLGELRAFFESRAVETVFRLRNEESLKIDAALTADGVTQDLFDLLEKAGPYGSGHPAPVFALPRHRILDARVVGTGHVRTELRSEAGGRITAMSFRSAETALGQSLVRSVGKTVHVAGSLSANYWNGMRSMQFRITDIAPAD